MLPFCERLVHVSRKEIAPVWTRSFPASRQPSTIGQHLRKRRFDLGMRQSEVARHLGVSNRTLSLWECDHVYPTWAKQPTVASYLGFDPFTDPSLGMPKSNKPPSVAFLARESTTSLSAAIVNLRIGLRKNRRQFAQALGVTA